MKDQPEQSMSTKVKTNAMRVLERAGIPFEIREYELDEEHFSAERVAALVGMAPETVFKTLIAHGDKTGYLFALIPAGTELDLRVWLQSPAISVWSWRRSRRARIDRLRARRGDAAGSEARVPGLRRRNRRTLAAGGAQRRPARPAARVSPIRPDRHYGAQLVDIARAQAN